MSFKTSPPAFVVAGLRELAAGGIMSRQLRDLYRDAADIIESLTKHATPPATIEQSSTVQTDRQAMAALTRAYAVVREAQRDDDYYSVSRKTIDRLRGALSVLTDDIRALLETSPDDR